MWIRVGTVTEEGGPARKEKQEQEQEDRGAETETETRHLDIVRGNALDVHPAQPHRAVDVDLRTGRLRVQPVRFRPSYLNRAVLGSLVMDS